MADDLSPRDYAFLILLNIEGKEMSNTELSQRYGVRLTGADCTRLNANGYVVSKTDQTPYRHALAPKGVKVLKAPLEVAEDGEKGATKRNLLWTALAALHESHQGDGDRPPAPVHGVRNLEQRIRDAYAELATSAGAWVSLSRLRPLFGDVSKADLDRALVSMLDASDVDLEPEANQSRLTQAERRAAVQIGGEDRHLLAIGAR